jgi:hypothetical protein
MDSTSVVVALAVLFRLALAGMRFFADGTVSGMRCLFIFPFPGGLEGLEPQESRRVSSPPLSALIKITVPTDTVANAQYVLLADANDIYEMMSLLLEEPISTGDRILLLAIGMYHAINPSISSISPSHPSHPPSLPSMSTACQPLEQLAKSQATNPRLEKSKTKTR